MVTVASASPGLKVMVPWSNVDLREPSGSAVSSIESWVERTCSTVPANDYSGTSTTTGTGGTLYACSASS